jgi:hypothetical protein
MIEILAHRANLNGPDPLRENSIAATRIALKEGFGLETDIRRDKQGRLYISHDPQPWSDENNFKEFAALFQNFPTRVIAMNVKELGYEAELIALQKSGKLGLCSFFFDFELLEPSNPGATQRLIRAMHGGDESLLASRLSDRSEPLEQTLSIAAQIVWADEFDSLWLTESDIQKVRAIGRKFYVISPELHGFDETARLRRWADFKQWGIDGICTDYALSAREFFSI